MRRWLVVPLGLLLLLASAGAASAADFTISPTAANPNQPITVTPVLSAAELANTEAVHYRFTDTEEIVVNAAPFDVSRTFPGYATTGDKPVTMQVEYVVGEDEFVTHNVRINAAPVAGFTRNVAVPNVGQSVRFDAGPTTDDETLANSAYEWDFDNNGTYEAVGEVIQRSFGSPGDKTVRLRVTDSLNRTDTATAVVHVNRPPVANFVYAPRSPLVNQSIDFASVSEDPDDPIVAEAWDLDGDGQYDDASGATVSRAFSSAGAHTVRLRVTDSRGRTATVATSVLVSSLPPAEPVTKIRPWPKIRIVGFAGGKRVRLDLLTVRTVLGSNVKVRCSGKGCPRKGAVSTRARGKLVRLRWLERRLRTGTRIYIAVTLPGRIGRYETIVLRKKKEPRRRTLCLYPGDTRARKC